MKIWLGKALQFLKEPHWFYSVAITLFFYAVACFARVKSIDVPLYHMDGAFQTASGLFRLLQGELPGRDFYPYLGIGPIGLIYPVFLLMGATLCASVFASFMMVYAANILSIAILVHLIWKPKSFLLSVLTACALFSIPLLLVTNASPVFGLYAIPNWLESMMSPGNSLRPLRGFIVYAVMAILYFVVFPEKRKYHKFVYYGITIAIASLWSNDYAWLTVATIFLLALGNFIKSENVHFFKTTIHLMLVSIVSVVLMQWLITGGHPLKLAKYNFIDVAGDQWWYFGPWLEVTRVFSPKEIIKILPVILDPVIHGQYAHYVLAASFVAIFIFRRLWLELLLVFVIGFLSLVGGFVACVGGHIGGYYFEGFIFWSKLVILLFGLRLIVGFILLLLAGWGSSFLRIIHVCICCLAVSAYAFYVHQEWVGAKRARMDNAAKFYVPELGGYFDPEWKEYINYIKAHKDNTTVEEYSGIWSALLKKPSIWPVDSAIHALGDVRKVAEKALREKADIVVTSNRAAGLEWFAWGESSNYWLYKILLDSYTPTLYSPFTIVWEKSKARESGKTVACRISDSKDRIFLDVADVGYYEVQLKTKIDKLNNNRYLVMFENNISFAGLELGELSVSPNDENRALLVYISNKENIDFGFNVRPAGAAHVSIESCSANVVPFKNEHVLLMSEGTEKIYAKHALDYVWDDPYFWDRGIATNQAGFLVYRDKKALAELQIGNAVQLPNNETRIITALGGSAAYLEVYLDGPNLNPDTIGLPSTFKVISDTEKLEALAVALGDAIFLTDKSEWRKGVSLINAQFIVPNTKKNRQLFKPMSLVKIPNTTDRQILNIVPSGVFLRVYIDGDLLDSATVGLPSKFNVIEARAPAQPVPAQPIIRENKIDSAKANAIKDDFFITNDTWINGVGYYEAAFLVKNTEDNLKLFVVGKRVKIPNTEEREIIKVVPTGTYIEVYVTGEPMDGSHVGLPSGFKVLSDKP